MIISPVSFFLAILPAAHAQLLPEPPIPTQSKNAKAKKQTRQSADLEWLFQYSPPPVDGREHELIQDPEYRPFLERNFTAPQSFWGPAPTDPKSPTHKSLPDTVDDFLTIPGKVLVDANRYITVTGAVRRKRTERGLIFADLGLPKSRSTDRDALVLFAAIDWIRDSKTTDDPDAQYTLWLFPNGPVGPPTAPNSLPPALVLALTRWVAEPLAGSGVVQKINHAILVAPDGTPTEIPVPTAAAAAPTEEAPVLTKHK